MLLACLFYAGYSLGLKNRPNVSGLVMMGYFSIAAFSMTIPLVLIETFIKWFQISNRKWMVYCFIYCTYSFLFVSDFFYEGVDLIGPSSAGLYANLVPIFSAVMAVIILDETFSFYHLIAMVIVFSGIYLI